MTFGPLALHIAGTLLVLTQPIFDSPGGIIYDIKHGLASGPLKPPVMTEGGFWHHGWIMALCQVSGLVCFVSASVWSIRIHDEEGAEDDDEEARQALVEKEAVAQGRAEYSATASP